MQTYYGVYQNTDLIEGKGAMVLVGIFADLSDATEVADKCLPKDMGGRGGVVRNLTVYESILEFAQHGSWYSH